MSTEAELLLIEWLVSEGLVPVSNTPEIYREQISWVLSEADLAQLIGWVLAHERRHETAGHRHTAITDEGDLNRLGFVHHRDGSWHVT